jgi:hypothetical protein
MMSTLPCPELDSLRLDYELTPRAGAEIEFPLIGSSIETTEPLATALDKSGARIRRTMAAKRIKSGANGVVPDHECYRRVMDSNYHCVIICP